MKLEKTIEDIKSLQPELDKLKALHETMIGQPKESKTNKHFKISVLKSGIRMFGCSAFIMGNIVIGGCLFFIAECCGVIEEL